MMIMTRLMPPTAPATVPTVRINATGSFDFDATDSMKKKNTNAITIRMRPTMTIRQFLRRIAAYSDRKHESLRPNGGVDAAARNCVTRKFSLRSSLVRLASNDLLDAASQWAILSQLIKSAPR